MKLQSTSKRKVIKVFIFIMIVVFLIVVILTQFLYPLKVKEVYFFVEPFSSEELQIRKSFYNVHIDDINSNNQFIRTENPFPSDDYTEYCHIVINPVLVNKSVFNVSVQDSFVKNTQFADKVIYKNGIVMNTNVGRFDNAIISDPYHLFVWRGDMTDEELYQYVKRLTFEVYYESDIVNSKKFDISLKNAKLVNHEDLVEIKQKHE